MPLVPHFATVSPSPLGNNQVSFFVAKPNSFGGSDTLVDSRIFAVSPIGFDSMNNAIMDWTRDGKLDNHYNGEVL